MAAPFRVPRDLSLSFAVLGDSTSPWAIGWLLARLCTWLLSHMHVSPSSRGSSQHHCDTRGLVSKPLATQSPLAQPLLGGWERPPCPHPSWAGDGSWLPGVTCRPSDPPLPSSAPLHCGASLPQGARAPGGQGHVWVILGPWHCPLQGGLGQELGQTLGRKRTHKGAPRCWGFQFLLEGTLSALMGPRGHPS